MAINTLPLLAHVLHVLKRKAGSAEIYTLISSKGAVTMELR